MSLTLVGADLKAEIAAYTDELKLVKVIKKVDRQREIRLACVCRRARLMSDAVTHRAIAAIGRETAGRRRPSFWALAAGILWIVIASATFLLPEVGEWDRTPLFAGLLGAVGATILIGALAETLQKSDGAVRIQAPRFFVLALFVLTWELVTAKLSLLPMPFFPSPQALLEVFVDDWARLWDSVWHSLLLLVVGYVIGGCGGFVVGVATGWSKAVGYWTHPLLRFLGPLPATAWLPIAFFVFPSSCSASTFLIALATGFPVTVLTWSGISSVDKSYYDVARTLGASERFLVLKVAIPPRSRTSSWASSWD